ncbi:MAG: hypothetical protein AB8H80_12130 [Planctomycetota bacterium]
MNLPQPRRLHALASVSLAMFLTAAAAPGQRLLAYDPMSAAVHELQPPDVVLPGPFPPVAVYSSVPVLPAPPGAAVATPGDSTFDNRGGMHWFTNGLVVASMPTPTFPPLVPPVSPTPIPAVILAAIGGPVTGMAIDPAANILYLCSAAGIVIGVTATPGLAVVVPAFDIPPGVSGITGLEWDGRTASLWACDAGSTCYHFLPSGVALGAPVVPAFAPPGPAGDVAIDKMAKANPVGVRPLYVTGGGMVYDVRDPGSPMQSLGAVSEGLSFANHALQVGPLGGCASCPTLPSGGPINTSAGPATSGNAGWSVGFAGLLPFSFCAMGFDTVYLPTFPTINTVGCPAGLSAGPTLTLFLLVADASGAVTQPISLAGVPVGATLYSQGFAFCSADPTGFVFSPFRAITVGGL